jgi:hypothetical protein
MTAHGRSAVAAAFQTLNRGTSRTRVYSAQRAQPPNGAFSCARGGLARSPIPPSRCDAVEHERARLATSVVLMCLSCVGADSSTARARRSSVLAPGRSGPTAAPTPLLCRALRWCVISARAGVAVECKASSPPSSATLRPRLFPNR